MGYLSHLVLGVGSMLLVKHMTGLTWSAVQWLLFVYALLAGGVLMGGISLLLTPLSFWWGESGAVTTGVLQWIMQSEEGAEAREKLRLNGTSTVLLISTEGDTSPRVWRDVCWYGRHGDELRVGE